MPQRSVFSFFTATAVDKHANFQCNKGVYGLLINTVKSQRRPPAITLIPYSDIN